ncbi:hypothetical protein GEV33_008491 [Tenebrio molitor]|uniref:Tyr recombinase domain-containing protein n=1 Tax=Tenebrio molitor TaxID=7067 RepID=A0A8J6HHN6_TENMO|nr:hypothetical protein GEV33_008491 [Tenebrio molitor]
MEKSNEVPENILKKANLLREKLLPVKSKAAYEKVYASFCYWRENNKVSAVTEEVILAYLDEKQETLSPASLWPHYSMLKSSLKVKENLCIEKFCSVTAYLKQINVGHHAKKSKVLSREHIEKFLLEAADETYLFVKAALIFGIAGACRRKELCDLTVNDIQDTGEVLIVTLRDTKTHLDRKFTIIGEGFVVNPLTIYRKYASLRPVNTSHDRFFLFYNNGKCTRQPVGINTFGQLPSKIAAYLKLEDPKTYTGHCFRRSSATLLAAGGGDLVSVKRHGGWRSSTVAEGYIEDCVEERIKIARKRDPRTARGKRTWDRYTHRNQSALNKNPINSWKDEKTTRTLNIKDTTGGHNGIGAAAAAQQKPQQPRHLNNDAAVHGKLRERDTIGAGRQQIIVRDATDNLLRTYLLNALLRFGGKKPTMNILHLLREGLGVLSFNVSENDFLLRFVSLIEPAGKPNKPIDDVNSRANRAIIIIMVRRSETFPSGAQPGAARCSFTRAAPAYESVPSNLSIFIHDSSNKSSLFSFTEKIVCNT